MFALGKGGLWGENIKTAPKGALTQGVTMRIYLIASNKGVRLVRANTRAQALNHVASQELTVRVASQDDLVKYLAEGSSIEMAVAPDQGKLGLV